MCPTFIRIERATVAHFSNTRKVTYRGKPNTLNAGYDDDNASLMRGCWAAAKVQGEGELSPLSTFRPYGLIRHYGCPKDAGEAGRRPGDIPPGDLFE